MTSSENQFKLIKPKKLGGGKGGLIIIKIQTVFQRTQEGNVGRQWGLGVAGFESCPRKLCKYKASPFISLQSQPSPIFQPRLTVTAPQILNLNAIDTTSHRDQVNSLLASGLSHFAKHLGFLSP